MHVNPADHPAAQPGQPRYERIGPPYTLRRRTRRTTWGCRVYHAPGKPFQRADAIHVAAHAVAASHFGIPIRRAVFDGRRRVFEAAWASLGYARDDARSEARTALERDCIALECGAVGQALARGWPHKAGGWHDESLAGDLMERMVYDLGVRATWQEYQRERARLAYRRREAKERYCLLHDPADRELVERAVAAERRGR